MLKLVTGTASYSGKDFGTGMNPTTGLPASEQIDLDTFRKSMIWMEVPAAPKDCPNKTWIAFVLQGPTFDALAPVVENTVAPTDRTRVADAVRMNIEVIEIFDIRPFHTMGIPVRRLCQHNPVDRRQAKASPRSCF